MGDAGEALIDAESRIQERMEELARERAEKRREARGNPEAQRAIESLRLARIDLERQHAATAHEARRHMLQQAMSELDQRITTMAGALR
jgi:hypothetical protein